MQRTTDTRGQQAAGTPADAWPYDHGPPVVSGGGQPAHLPRPVPTENQWPWRSFWALLLLKFAAEALDEWSRLTLLGSFVMVYGAATVFGYWVGERPRQSFPSWALKVVGIGLNCYVGLATVPLSLRVLLPGPLAFGLPAFIVALLYYWVPPMKAAGRTTPLWQWLLWAATFAVFWGWWGANFSK